MAQVADDKTVFQNQFCLLKVYTFSFAVSVSHMQPTKEEIQVTRKYFFKPYLILIEAQKPKSKEWFIYLFVYQVEKIKKTNKA